MSVLVSAQVWRASKASGTALLVMLALADYADENGRAWPSYETLARKCRTSRRNIIKTIDKLKLDGELLIEQRTAPLKKPRPDQSESRWHTSNIYHLRPGGEGISLCDMVNSSTLPMVNSSTPPSELQYTTCGELQYTRVVNASSPGVVNSSSPESSIETSKEAAKEKSSVEAATRASARAGIAAAAADPDPSKIGAVAVERHALIDAWALAHQNAGRAAVITSDLQALAQALEAEGVVADELYQMVTDKLAGREDGYSFRFIRQDYTAWRNARFRSQMTRPDGQPPRAQGAQARRYEAEAWEPPADPPQATPALFDARWRAIFDKAWMSLNDQVKYDSAMHAFWRHLQGLKLVDADGARWTLATDSPATKDNAGRWLKTIERALFDAGNAAVPRDVEVQVMTTDEWKERQAKAMLREPLAVAAAASF